VSNPEFSFALLDKVPRPHRHAATPINAHLAFGQGLFLSLTIGFHKLLGLIKLQSLQQVLDKNIAIFGPGFENLMAPVFWPVRGSVTTLARTMFRSMYNEQFTKCCPVSTAVA